MSAQFKVGEIACFVCDVKVTDDVGLRSYDGMDTLITESYDQHPSWDSKGRPTHTFGYVVLFADGCMAVAEPHELRKKQFPASADSIMREAINKAKKPCEVAA